MTRRFVLCAIFVLLAIMFNAQNKDTQKWVDVVKTEKLIVLKPNFTSIDLVFGNSTIVISSVNQIVALARRRRIGRWA